MLAAAIAVGCGGDDDAKSATATPKLEPLGFSLYRQGPGSRAITVLYFTSSSARIRHVDVKQTGASVEIGLREQPCQPTASGCTAKNDDVPGCVRVTLRRPLGRRRVVDATRARAAKRVSGSRYAAYCRSRPVVRAG